MPIWIDSRGKGEHEIADRLMAKKYPVELKYIESGDIVFDEVAIERKTISDLIGSVIGGKRHLWEQLKVMKDTYKKPLILIEGFIDWDDKLTSSIIISIVEGWGIPYINTSGIAESVKIIGRIFDKYGTTKTAKIPPPAVKKAASTKKIRWCMLQTIKGIGGTTASRILEENPYIFSNRVKTHNFKIKGLNKQSRELLEKVLSNE